MQIRLTCVFSVLSVIAFNPGLSAFDININASTGYGPVEYASDFVAPDQSNFTISTFYEALAPHGTWVYYNNSWCWQPGACAVDPGWRPYCDSGHWSFTDSGWCWQSDYAWGWAPFHYGRWERCNDFGWLWTPGYDWAPAWVSWRECESHCGWAPLPPACEYASNLGLHLGGNRWGVDLNFGLRQDDYCFVPVNHFCDGGNVRQFVALPDQHVTIFNNTTIIQNNITYNDNRIIVNGPRVERVQRYTSTRIQPLRLADVSVQSGRPLRAGSQEDRSRGELQIYRPKVVNAAPEAPATVVNRLNTIRGLRAPTPVDSRDSIQRQAHFENVHRWQQQAVQRPLQTETIRQVPQSAVPNSQRNTQSQPVQLDANSELARNAQLEVTARNAQAEARRRAQAEAAQRDSQLETQRRAQAEAANREAQAEARRRAPAESDQLGAQHRAQAEAASREAEARRRTQAETAQLEAQRRAQAEAANRDMQTELRRRARIEAAQRDTQLEAQRRGQVEAGSRQAQLEAQHRTQQDLNNR